MKIRSIFIFLLAILPMFQVIAQSSKQVFTNLDVFQLEWVSDPRISPDGNRIVYLRNGFNIMKDRRQRSLWTVNTDGSNHMKLTSRDVNESSPRWSPDGTRIAFVSSSENGSEIYVYWISSGKMARLTQLDRSPGGLSWSPDGMHIAFSMLVPDTPPFLVKSPKAPKGAKWADKPRVTTRLKYEQDGSGYIEPGFHHFFIIPSEGGTPRQVTSGDYFHRGTPQWSKDGKQLIFSSNRNENWEYEFRNSEIYSVSIENGEIEPLTDRNGPDRSPAVSPDGKKIAYLGFEDKVQTYQITKLFLMNLDGSGKKGN